jgi:hypothetical protein
MSLEAELKAEAALITDVAAVSGLFARTVVAKDGQGLRLHFMRQR